MRLFRRRCAFLLDLLALASLFLLAVLVVTGFWRRSPRGRGSAGVEEPSFLVPFARVSEETGKLGGMGLKLGVRSVLPLPLPASTRSARERSQPTGADAVAANCTMSRCFDATKCRNGFFIYVYPDTPGLKASGFFQKFLRVLRTSRYYTSDPDKACLFVPSWDTLDRDRLSDGYVHHLPSPFLLEHWNGGRNHIFFNLYSGSWPSYEESLDFNLGLAIIAKASFNAKSFRHGYDISLPLMHSSHPEKGTIRSVLSTEGKLLPPKRRYLLAFKGKRYLYGLGIEPRRSLYHVHNRRDIVIATTCRHNRNWERYQDERCSHDNSAYDRWGERGGERKDGGK